MLFVQHSPTLNTMSQLHQDTYVEIGSNNSYSQYRFTENLLDKNTGILDLCLDISNITTEVQDMIMTSISGLTSLEIKDRYTILVKKGELFRWKEEELISKLYDKLITASDNINSSLEDTGKTTVIVKIPYELWNHIQWIGKKKGETFNEVIDAAVLAYQRTHLL